jgi:hypothetical protein
MQACRKLTKDAELKKVVGEFEKKKESHDCPVRIRITRLP